jgi:hypothetical protein
MSGFVQPLRHERVCSSGLRACCSCMIISTSVCAAKPPKRAASGGFSSSKSRRNAAHSCDESSRELLGASAQYLRQCGLPCAELLNCLPLLVEHLCNAKGQHDEVPQCRSLEAFVRHCADGNHALMSTGGRRPSRCGRTHRPRRCGRSRVHPGGVAKNWRRHDLAPVRESRQRWRNA